MGHKVLKPFDYAADGHTTRRVEVGEELSDVRADIATGLIAEGYIANAAAAETASKIAGETIAAADHSGHVDDPDAVSQEMLDAKSRISDGKIGAPEARQIVDDHKLDPLPSEEVVEKAEEKDSDQKPAAKKKTDGK